MAHHTEQVGYPALPLNGTMRVRLRALSPTTDTVVTGVTSSLWALYGRDESELATVPTDDLPILVLPFSVE